MAMNHHMSVKKYSITAIIREMTAKGLNKPYKEFDISVKVFYRAIK